MSNYLRVIISDPLSEEENTETQIIVPDTGAYTGGQTTLKNQNYFNIGLLFLLTAIVVTILYTAINKIIKATRLNKHFSVDKKTKIGYGFFVFMMLVGCFGFFVGGLVAESGGVMAADPVGSDTPETPAMRDGEEVISVTAEDVTIEIERTGEPVFAVGSATIMVNETIEGDYALHISATRSSDLRLVGAESSNEKISSIDVFDAPLRLNTYGITMEQGTSYDDWGWDQVLVSPSSSSYFGHFRSPVSAGDEATVYFGVYIDDSLPAGIYETEVDYWLVKGEGTT